MSEADFFRQPLAEMIDPRHPLAVLAGRLPWAQIEAALALRGSPTWCAKVVPSRSTTCSVLRSRSLARALPPSAVPAFPCA